MRGTGSLRSRRVWLALAGALAVSGSPVRAQFPTGSISGLVQDGSGAPPPDASPAPCRLRARYYLG